MKYFWGTKKALSSFLIALMACILIASFGLHTLQTKHQHYGHGSSHSHSQGSEVVQLGEYMHASDKKLFFFVLLSFLLPGLFIRRDFFVLEASDLFLLHIFMYMRKRKTISLFPFSFYRKLFSIGILNPKLY